MPHSYSRLTLPLLFLFAAGTATALPPDLRALLTRHAGFTADHVDAVQSGSRVVRALETARIDEVAFAGATRLPIPLPLYLERLRSGTLYRPDEHVTQIGRFSDTPSTSDLKELRFESYDLSGASVEAAAESNRNTLLAAIAEFEKKGSISVGALGEAPRPIDRIKQFDSLVRQARYLRERWPAAYSAVLKSHGRTARDFFIWKQLNFGLRTVTRVAHVSVWEDERDGRCEALVLTTQIYANRYFEASFQIDHLVSDESRDGLYCVTLNYGRSEFLTGLTGKLIRPLVVSRTLALAERTLDRARRDLQAERRNTRG